MKNVENKLSTLFPTGEWDSYQHQWMVPHGQYHCAVAVIEGDDYVLTPLGEQLLNPEQKPAPAPAEDVELPKRRGRKPKTQLEMDFLDG